jgi:hypothetical protein
MGPGSRYARPGRQVLSRSRVGKIARRIAPAWAKARCDFAHADKPSSAPLPSLLLIRDRHGLQRVPTLQKTGKYRDRTNQRGARGGAWKPHPEEARSAVSKDETSDPLPSCFETHRSALRRRQRLRSRRAAMLLSMRAGERCAFWPNETPLPSSPRKREPRITGRCSWVPALRPLCGRRSGRQDPTAILAKRSQQFWSSPRKRGPRITGRRSWIPALGSGSKLRPQWPLA